MLYGASVQRMLFLGGARPGVPGPGQWAGQELSSVLDLIESRAPEKLYPGLSLGIRGEGGGGEGTCPLVPVCCWVKFCPGY